MGTAGAGAIRPTAGTGGIKANGKLALFDAGGAACDCCLECPSATYVTCFATDPFNDPSVKVINGTVTGTKLAFHTIASGGGTDAGTNFTGEPKAFPRLPYSYSGRIEFDAFIPKFTGGPHPAGINVLMDFRFDLDSTSLLNPMILEFRSERFSSIIGVGGYLAKDYIKLTCGALSLAVNRSANVDYNDTVFFDWDFDPGIGILTASCGDSVTTDSGTVSNSIHPTPYECQRTLYWQGWSYSSFIPTVDNVIYTER